MKWIKNRILNHKISSSIGIVALIAFAFLMVWKGKATFEEISGFLTTLGAFLIGIFGLFSKDPKRFQKKEEQYRDEASKMSSSDLARATDDLLK